MASEFENGVTSEQLEGAVAEPGPFWDLLEQPDFAQTREKLCKRAASEGVSENRTILDAIERYLVA